MVVGHALAQQLGPLPTRGLPNLWIPGVDAFARIEEIPVLGSGKLDLKHLGDLARERFGRQAGE